MTEKIPEICLCSASRKLSIASPLTTFGPARVMPRSSSFQLFFLFQQLWGVEDESNQYKNLVMNSLSLLIHWLTGPDVCVCKLLSSLLIARVNKSDPSLDFGLPNQPWFAIRLGKVITSSLPRGARFLGNLHRNWEENGDERRDPFTLTLPPKLTRQSRTMPTKAYHIISVTSQVMSKRNEKDLTHNKKFYCKSDDWTEIGEALIASNCTLLHSSQKCINPGSGGQERIKDQLIGN